jgi:hypothetical protein
LLAHYSSASEFHVLDVLTREDEAVVVCSVDGQVGLWRVEVLPGWPLPDGWTWIMPGMEALRTPLKEGSVSVALHPAPGMTWDLTIIDRRRKEPWVEKYSQRSGEWIFDPVELPPAKWAFLGKAAPTTAPARSKDVVPGRISGAP